MSRARRAAALLLLLAGCYHVRFERRAAAESGAPRELWHHGILGGLWEVSGPVKLGEICPAGIVSVENYVTPLQAVAQGVTAGVGLAPVQAVAGGGLLVLQAPVWEPSLVRVVCAKDGVSAGGRERRLKIALLRLAPLGDVDPKTAAVFSEALAGELRKRAGLSVMSESDIGALLGVEKTRAMLGCTDSGCIAEVGGALGADRVVHGSVGRVGTSLLVNLTSLDPKKASHAASVSERLKGASDEAFLDALPRIVDALIAE